MQGVIYERGLTEVEAVEIVKLPRPVMPSEEEHHIFIHSGRGPIATLGPHTVPVGFQVYLRPGSCLKVEAIEVISIMPVISTEHVQAIFVDHSGVTVPRGRCRPHLAGDLLPCSVIHTVFVEIIHPVEAIVPTENVYRPIMHN